MITKKGTVVKVIDDNTAKVEVHSYRQHKIYKKRYRITKRFLVDTSQKLEVGQKVEIEQCRPVSKRKHWKLVVNPAKK
jgi:small subunit ribosomal protein S17